MKVIYEPNQKKTATVNGRIHYCSDDIQQADTHGSKLYVGKSVWPRNKVVECSCGQRYITRFGSFTYKNTLVKLRWYHVAKWKIRKEPAA